LGFVFCDLEFLFHVKSANSASVILCKSSGERQICIPLTPALQFNGTTSKMNLPASSTLGIQSNPYEMFIVVKSSSSNVQFLIAGGSTEQFEYHLNGVGARFIPVTSAYLDKGAAGNYTDGNAHIFSARASLSGGAVRVDGIDGGTSASNILSANSGNLLLGV